MKLFFFRYLSFLWQTFDKLKIVIPDLPFIFVTFWQRKRLSDLTNSTALIIPISSNLSMTITSSFLYWTLKWFILICFGWEIVFYMLPVFSDSPSFLFRLSFLFLLLIKFCLNDDKSLASPQIINLIIFLSYPLMLFLSLLHSLVDKLIQLIIMPFLMLDNLRKI